MDTLAGALAMERWREKGVSPADAHWTMFPPRAGTSISGEVMPEPEFITLDHVTPRADLDVLVGLLRGLPAWGPGDAGPTVVEIGCWTGMSTSAMAEAGATVHSIDHFQGNPDDRLGGLAKEHSPARIIRAFCHNLKPWLFRTVHLHIGTSAFHAGIWPFQVDMVFIDGDHRYGCVRDDIKDWWPHVKRGGIICGHDYPNFEGVRHAVNEFCCVAANDHLDVLTCGGIGHKSNIWWRRKV